MVQQIKTKSSLACLLVLLVPFTSLIGCGPSAETSKKETAAPVTKEELYRQGHALYARLELDSARSLLTRALVLDASYTPALADLAALTYDLAMRAETGKNKMELLRASREYYRKLETLGALESEAYERLCEIADALHDAKTFLKYAKKNADVYPYDRQFSNLAVAYVAVEDYASAIKVCKEAIEKFPSSPFIGAFYRQLGRAYMKVDRDQTAERTFYAGLAVIDKKMAELRKQTASDPASAGYQRLKNDKIGILTSLKYLHTTYKAMDKLAEVERQLKELGK
ncbi:MAG: hypothetical protein C4326_10700 [Ignavibacteria bacterium]